MCSIKTVNFKRVGGSSTASIRRGGPVADSWCHWFWRFDRWRSVASSRWRRSRPTSNLYQIYKEAATAQLQDQSCSLLEWDDETETAGEISPKKVDNLCLNFIHLMEFIECLNSRNLHFVDNISILLITYF